MFIFLHRQQFYFFSSFWLVSLFDFASEINFFYLTSETKYFARKNKNFFCACYFGRNISPFRLKNKPWNQRLTRMDFISLWVSRTVFTIYFLFCYLNLGNIYEGYYKERYFVFFALLCFTPYFIVHTQPAKLQKKQCGGVYFCVNGTAFSMPIQQKLSPPLLLHSDFADWVLSIFWFCLWPIIYLLAFISRYDVILNQ